MSQARRPLSVRRKLMYSAAALVVVLGAVEGVFRLSSHTDDSSAHFLVPDAELLWRLDPHMTGSLATNKLGIRDTSYNAAADKKILLLGDSVSWGHAMKFVEEVYPQVLQMQLNEAGGRTVEVINAAVPGYSTFQQLKYLQMEGVKLDPDLIILQFCLNDVVERYTTVVAYGGPSSFMGVDTRQSVRGAYGRLVRHSRAVETILRWAQHQARDRQAYKVMNLAQDTLPAELEEAWALTLSELDGIRDVARSRGIDLLIAIMPYRFQFEDPQRLNQPQRVLVQYAKKNNVGAVDLLPLMAGFVRQNPKVALFQDANHLSPEGHQFVAKALAGPVSHLLDDGSGTGTKP